MKTDAVSQAIVALFERERFYAELVIQMRRVLNPKLPAVAGVCIKDSVELHINLDGFTLPDGQKVAGFAELSLATRVAILKHECEHILRGHIPRMKEIAPDIYGKSKDAVEGLLNQKRHMSLNIAADMAINGAIPDLPKEGVFAKNFNLPDGETFEWYHQNLKGNDKMKEIGFDDHSLWGESEGEEDVVKEKMRQAINKAADKARAVGMMSADHELIVNEWNPPSISWKSQLRRFVARSMEVKITTSKKKRNRRYGITQPGHVKEEVLHIGVARDTSGSVSDEALAQFDAELAAIGKYAKVTVVDADAEIKNAYVFNPKKKRAIKGRGGTAYKPVFDYFNELGDIDGLIYFGDMDCFDQEELVKPKYPVLWAIVGNQNPPANFGGKIFVKVK